MLSRPAIAELVVQSLGGDCVRDLNIGDGWPARVEVLAGADWQRCLLFVGAIGPAGRNDRPSERRVQNPERREVFALHKHWTLLMGLGDATDGKQVVVSWEPNKRLGKTTRFSLFVPQAAIDIAAANGTASHRTASREAIQLVRLEQLRQQFDALPRCEGTPSDESGEGQGTMSDVDEISEETNEMLEIAAKLATLSDAEVLPDNESPAGTPFTADDVDVESNLWISKVVEVQSWLSLEGELAGTRSPQEVLDQLFAWLAPDGGPECYRVANGCCVLTEHGVSVLTSRLDIAVSLKDAFVEAIEAGASVADATSSWREGWDDSLTNAGDTPVKVHASVETWMIHTVKERVRENGLDLNPSYQRGNVWSVKESSDLIDSILRGIPLPSIILNKREDPDEDSATLDIVDGKQRLTAMLRFIGWHPDCRRFVLKIQKDSNGTITEKQFDENFKKWRAQVRKRRGLTAADEAKHFLPFPYRLPKAGRSGDPLAALSGKYYFELKSTKVDIQGQPEAIRTVFELPMTSYKLSVILYKNTDVNQIHKVFGLYNRQGKKLNATEVRNAVYHHLNLAKLVLLLAGDSDDRTNLAPYLPAAVDVSPVKALLGGLNVSEGRFNRTKLVSWVCALLAHSPGGSAKAVACPGSSSLIEGMMMAIADKKKSHVLAVKANCTLLAEDIVAGSQLFDQLCMAKAINPKLTHPKKPGANWEDLPAVGVWLACTLLSIAGVTDALAIRDSVRTATDKLARLKKQQARSQWVFIAKLVLGILDAVGVDRTVISKKLTNRYAYDCLATLEARRVIDEG